MEKNISSQDKLGDFGELPLIVKAKLSAKTCRRNMGKISCLKELDKQILKDKR